LATGLQRVDLSAQFPSGVYVINTYIHSKRRVDLAVTSETPPLEQSHEIEMFTIKKYQMFRRDRIGGKVEELQFVSEIILRIPTECNIQNDIKLKSTPTYYLSYKKRWPSFGGDVRLELYGKDHMIILMMLDLVF